MTLLWIFQHADDIALFCSFMAVLGLVCAAAAVLTDDYEGL